jgi:hypothetical protein
MRKRYVGTACSEFSRAPGLFLDREQTTCRAAWSGPFAGRLLILGGPGSVVGRGVEAGNGFFPLFPASRPKKPFVGDRVSARSVSVFRLLFLVAPGREVNVP